MLSAHLVMLSAHLVMLSTAKHLVARRARPSSLVMLSAAKHLVARRATPYASLTATQFDCSNFQGLFFTIEPCLTELYQTWSQGSSPFSSHSKSRVV